MDQDNLFADAAQLAEALTGIAVEYQKHFRATDDPDVHRHAMAQLSDKWDPDPSKAMVRRLEMEGYDGAAAAFEELSTAVFRVIAALDVHWEYDYAVEDINIDIGAMREKVLDQLAHAGEASRQREDDGASTGRVERVSLLTEAAVLADKLFSVALEYESYRDGCFDPDNEEESSEDRMKRAAHEYGQLKPAPVIEKLKLKGLRAAAIALDDLTTTTSEVVQLREDDAVDDSKVVEDLSSSRDMAIEALKGAR